jgi:ankyrin repeat protein
MVLVWIFQTIRGCTPLSQAAFNGVVEIVRELLNYGASVDIADDEGDTSLHEATLFGQVEIVRVLLNHCCSVDIGNDRGCTPPIFTCSNGNMEALRELMIYGARTNTELTRGGYILTSQLQKATWNWYDFCSIMALLWI